MAVARARMMPFSGIRICRPAAMTALPLLTGPGPNCTPRPGSTPWDCICWAHCGVVSAASLVAGDPPPANSTKTSSSVVSANGASIAAAAYTLRRCAHSVRAIATHCIGSVPRGAG